MFDKISKHISIETQGILATILGLILILGTLGKLQVLQGILNSVMIVTGVLLLIWGLHTSKGINKVKSYLQAKK